MRKLYLLLALMVMGVALGAGAYNTVLVNMADGTQQRVRLRADLTLKVGADAMEIQGTGISVQYPMADVTDYRFGGGEFSGIADLDIDEQAGTLSLDTPGAQLMDIQGRVLGAANDVDLRALPAGVYVITIPGTRVSAKILIAQD